MTWRVRDERLLPDRNRALRVAAAVAVLWVLNAFDLVLTQEAAGRDMFAEANLLVTSWVQMPVLLAVYKVALVATGTVTLFRLRHTRQAEIGCWGLVAVYAGVLCVWARYYEYVEIYLSYPAKVRPRLMF